MIEQALSPRETGRAGPRRRIGAALVAVVLCFAAGSAAAQQPPPAAQPGEPGYSRIQGQTPGAPRPGLGGFGSQEQLLDLKEEMREFVQRIAEYARSQNSGTFAVVVRNGLELVGKRNELDETIVNPARTYMQAIDGVFVDGLSYGLPTIGEPTIEERRARLQPLLEIAGGHGVAVMVMDYAREPAKIDAIYRDLADRGYIPFVAASRGPRITSLPDHPRRPYRENPNNVLTLAAAKNYVYIGQSTAFGRPDEFALALHGTNYDAVVVDVFHGREPLSRQAVETLKYKKLGARRLVLARMDVGTAASYRYYWKGDWQEGSPAFVSAPVPGDPDRHFVEYWRPEWQQVITGNTQSYVYGLVRQGYDGVIIEGMESITYFEGGIEAVQSLLLP